MSEGTTTAIATVAIAAINTVGSILLTWIRARYRWKNGVAGAPTDPTPQG